MKKGALLVNTARGPIVNFEALLLLLESNEISINLAFDVFENEPLDEDILHRFHLVHKDHPELKFIFIPHNASADADTRAQMAIMFLSDIIALATSTSGEDLKSIRMIPEQKLLQSEGNYEDQKIAKQWIN